MDLFDTVTAAKVSNHAISVVALYEKLVRVAGHPCYIATAVPQQTFSFCSNVREVWRTDQKAQGLLQLESRLSSSENPTDFKRCSHHYRGG